MGLSVQRDRDPARDRSRRGIFYTARKDLSAGFQLVSRRFAVTPQVNVSWSTFIATAGLRYFWF
jgi:hypothetical protein